MKTVAVVSTKGGSGKTTLALNLAVAGYRRGRRTLVADIDPQRSSSLALKARNEPGPDCVTAAGGKLFQIQQAAMRGGLDLLVIDTPGYVESEIAEAMRIADLCVLVARPTYLDLAAAVHTADLAMRFSRRPLVVLNQAPVARRGVEPPTVAKALQALAVAGLDVSAAVVRARATFQTSVGMGYGAEEWDDQAPAACEVAALWNDIDRRLAGGWIAPPRPAFIPVRPAASLTLVTA